MVSKSKLSFQSRGIMLGWRDKIMNENRSPWRKKVFNFASNSANVFNNGITLFFFPDETILYPLCSHDTWDYFPVFRQSDSSPSAVMCDLLWELRKALRPAAVGLSFRILRHWWSRLPLWWMYGLFSLSYPTEKRKKWRSCRGNLRIKSWTQRIKLFVKVELIYFWRSILVERNNSKSLFLYFVGNVMW